MMDTMASFVVLRFITFLTCNFWCTVAFITSGRNPIVDTVFAIIIIFFSPNRLHAVRHQQATTMIQSDFELIQLKFHASLVTVGVVYLSYRTIEIPLLLIQFVCYSNEEM